MTECDFCGEDCGRKCRAAMNYDATVADHVRLARNLGECIGFGALMQATEAAWRQVNEERGWSRGSEHSHGCCVFFLVPCPSPCHAEDDGSSCEWCCGSLRVTKRVAEAMQARGGSAARYRRAVEARVAEWDYAADCCARRTCGMVTLALEDPARFAAECDRLDGRYTRAARRARAILERLEVKR